jgi:hypothetical protein
MRQFLWGALSLASAVAGLFFFRFWILTRDRFFVFFALAFWTLALHWTGLGIADPGIETRHYLFLVRLLAFILIIAGILDKNRSARGGPRQ